MKGGRKVGGSSTSGPALSAAGKNKSGSVNDDGWREDELGANEVKGGHIPGVL